MRRLGWKRKNIDGYTDGKRQLRIGVIGAAKGIGTTHLALMLACYYSGGCGRRTAVIECGKNDYMKICNETSTKIEDIRHFTYKHIDFNSCRTSKEIADCLSKSYEVAVMDMEAGAQGALEEFKRCDVRIVVGTTAVWKAADVRRTMEELENVDCAVAIFMPNYRRLRHMEELRGSKVFDIPAEPDPLSITSATMCRLREFLNRQCR